METLILALGMFLLGLGLGFNIGEKHGIERSRYAIHAALSRVSLPSRTEFIAALASFKGGKDL